MCYVLVFWGVGQPCMCWWEQGQTLPRLQDAPVLAHDAASSFCHHEQKKILLCEDSEALAQVTQKSCGCPTPRSVQG